MTENEHQNRHLRHMVVDGFKSIKSLDLKLGAINIFIGANGAGKSNFFHFGAKNTAKINIEVEVGNNGYHVVFSHGANNDSLVFDEEYCLFTGSNKKFSIKGAG